MSTGSVHLVKGDDPVLRGAAVDRLVGELLQGEPREFALEDYTIPGRRRAGAEEPRDDDEPAIRASCRPWSPRSRARRS